MATSFDYIQQTQRFLREQKQDLLDPQDLLNYVNRARREVAGATQCVRRLTPISGAISGATIINGGINYSSQTTVTVTPPDFPSGKPPYPNGLQATAVPVVQNGVITSINFSNGGNGYFQPVLEVTDPTNAGSGAEITLTVAGVNLLQPNQEQYLFSDIDVSIFPGVSEVYSIKSVSVIYDNYRYSLPMYSFSVYQSQIRQYPFQYTYVPTFCSQFGQGADGSFFAYPWPSQIYQWEFDCFCLPQDFQTINAQDADVIPQPWADVVPYFAAHLAYLELQNLNAAKFYLDLFDKMLGRKSVYARPGRVTNPYGRW